MGVEDLARADEVALAKLGYKQELKRSWGFFLNMGTSLGFIGYVSSVATLYTYAATTGGPQIMLIGWTAGGLYYWSAKLSPPEWGPWMAWLTGWFNICGMLVGGASTALIVSSLVASLIQMNNPDFVPSSGFMYGVGVAFAVLGGVLNSMGERFLRYATYLALIGIGTGVFVIGIPMLVMSPVKATAQETFGTFVDMTGWDNSAVVSQLGLLMPIWVFWGYDASAHLSEETLDSASTPARSIVIALGASQVLGYAFVLILNFTVPDIDGVLECSYAQPLVCAFEQATGGSQSVTMFLTIWMIFQFIWNIQTAQNGGSRALYAWARDGALPKFFHWVHPETKQPLRTVWFFTIISCVLLLANFGSSVAISAFSAFSTIGMNVAYALPTLCKLIWARNTFKQSAFNLGRLSIPINIIAVLWMFYVVAILCIPQLIPVTASTLNYSPVMLGGVFILITIYWYAGARKWFVGPKLHITLEEAEELEKEKYDQDMQKASALGVSV
ncbi:amino acid transporter [Gonapodya prolifera JEL478]|uniref:Amino acid transporter n=1 Tax=Gonapodya prolifera (strain JEL478) TaxID=1344416 RepID=A0A139A9J4_GONPJ|nr:amino acid transporter [Gonapodya prolifera JEL478]|eukprot:KXS13436.1 amino acid transporter [Gonapodya prolifera JEL478]